MLTTNVIEHFGLLGLAIALFVETAFFIGAFLPGDSLIFSYGILASAGKMSFSLSLFVGAVGAYLGYVVAYWLGKKYGTRVFSSHSRSVFSRENLERAERYFKRFGPMTILFARLVPFLRVVAGPMAGAAHMNKKKFELWNFIGAILWPLTMLSTGYFFGNIIPNPDRFIFPIIVAVIILSTVFPFIIKAFMPKKKIEIPDETRVSDLPK